METPSRKPSEPPPPLHFGLSPAQALRSAALVTLIGLTGVWLLTRLMDREGTPLHALLTALNLTSAQAFQGGALVVITAVFVAGYPTLNRRPRFVAREDGLAVGGPMGAYVIRWDNIEALEVLYDRDLGIRVRSMDPILASHEGTENQRELLRTSKGYKGWDFTFMRHELGRPAAEVVEALGEYRERYR